MLKWPKNGGAYSDEGAYSDGGAYLGKYDSWINYPVRCTHLTLFCVACRNKRIFGVLGVLKT